MNGLLASRPLFLYHRENHNIGFHLELIKKVDHFQFISCFPFINAGMGKIKGYGLCVIAIYIFILLCSGSRSAKKSLKKILKILSKNH